MHKKLLESNRKQPQKLKSPPIRQSSSGNKNIKLTNHGIKNQKQSLSKQPKQNKLTIFQPPQNKKSPSKNARKQDKQMPKDAKEPQIIGKQKQKTKTKIISYKTQQTKQQQQSYQKSVQKSLVNIQLQDGLEQTLDDDINLLSITNYQKANKYQDFFLSQTHITNGMSKKNLSKQKQKQRIQKENKLKILEQLEKLKQKQKQLQKLINNANNLSNQQRSQANYSNNNDKKNIQRKDSLTLNNNKRNFQNNDVVIVAKKSKVKRLSSWNKDLQQFEDDFNKLSKQKSNKNLQRSLNGTLEKSTKKLELSAKKYIEKSNKGLLKSKKGSKKKKQDGTDSSKKRSSKNSKQKNQVSVLGNANNNNMKKIPSSLKPPSKKSKPKSSSKDTKFNTNKKSSSKLSKPKPSTLLKNQQSSSDTTNAPTLQQLQKLRQQNQKYKLFLATSAFKVQQLKRQIQQSKQVRQTQRSMYNFQLQNLKKQLDSNKRFLGHLYSYDDNTAAGKDFLPEQIIIETDNESSSVLDSINVMSKVSKPKGSEENISENNRISSLVSSDKQISNSNPKSDSSKQIQDYQKQMNIQSPIFKVKKKNLANQSNSQKQNEKQIERKLAKMKYLQEINKIPSLVMNLSLKESDKGTNASKQTGGGTNGLKDKKLKSPQKNLDILKKSEQYTDAHLLLLNSKGK